jgi:8-oxo-dGTP pyrophosphatase MutT (NUDIX family)
MMIRFSEGNKIFNYRIVGVAVHEGSVLLHQGEGENFWTFPGGRAEFGETAEQTLQREMKEEIGAEVEVVRLLWFAENFFTYAGSQFHEIALYFLMRFSSASAHLLQANSFQGHEEGMKLTYQWFPRQAEVLTGLPLLPAFLQIALQTLPESAQHVVQDDGAID